MLKPGRLLIAAVVVLNLIGCSKPANPPTGKGAESSVLPAVAPTPGAPGAAEEPLPDVNAAKGTTKEFVQAYYAALVAHDYAKAATFWSPKAGKTAESLAIPGVSDIFVVKTVLMSLSNIDEEDQVYLQVTAAPGVTGDYRNGKVTRWFVFDRKGGDLKIKQIK